MKTGIELIAEERLRQVEAEGWTHEHDDQHEDGALALVAALYATPIPLYTLSIDDDRDNERKSHRGLTVEANDPWPAEWTSAFDKRQKYNRLRQLVVAGALIAAEIDRLMRRGG